MSNLQLTLWIGILSIFIFMSIFIFINEKAKHESYKLSEETEILRTFQEKEKIRNQKKKEDEDLKTVRNTANNIRSSFMR